MGTTPQIKVLPWTNGRRQMRDPKALADESGRESASIVLHLFDQFQMRMLGYALSFGLSPEDAEDTVQEAFLSLFRHLESGRPCSNLHGWLFRVVHNLALKRRTFNHSHRRRVVDSVDLDSQASPVSDAHADLVFNQEQQQLKAVFRILPETERRCLSLRAEGFKYREISKILGVSLGTVASSISRSLARMLRATGKE